MSFSAPAYAFVIAFGILAAFGALLYALALAVS